MKTKLRTTKIRIVMYVLVDFFRKDHRIEFQFETNAYEGSRAESLRIIEGVFSFFCIGKG